MLRRSDGRLEIVTLYRLLDSKTRFIIHEGNGIVSGIVSKHGENGWVRIFANFFIDGVFKTPTTQCLKVIVSVSCLISKY